MSALNVESLKEMTGPGMITANKAIVWFRTEDPGKYILRWKKAGSPEESFEETRIDIKEDNESDNTFSVTLPVNEGEKLDPLTTYEYQLVKEEDGSVVMTNDFQTAPKGNEDAPEKFSFGLLSCNQPFDPQGNMNLDAFGMFRALNKIYGQHDVKFTFAVGDQMYTDYPPECSIFDEEYFAKIAPEGRKNIFECTAEEVRRIYQERYKKVWGLPGYKELLERYTMLMMMDDHDIVDNWRSVQQHFEEKWEAIAEGATKAYTDYQASRIKQYNNNIPEDFHFSYDYGNITTFTFDLRSQRTAGDDGILFDDNQKNDFMKFLENAENKDVVFIVLTVPIVHLPKILAQVSARTIPGNEDFSDRWSSWGHIRDRDFVLKKIYDFQEKYPDKKVIVLTGDIHIGTVHEIYKTKNHPPFYQFVSSPVTNMQGLPIRLGSKLLVRSKFKLKTEDGKLDAQIRLVKGDKGHNKNPYDGRNAGIVEIDNTDKNDPKVTLHLYGHKNGEPFLAFKKTL